MKAALFGEPIDGDNFVVLNSRQLGNWDLVCFVRSRYPWVRIIAQKLLI